MSDPSLPDWPQDSPFFRRTKVTCPTCRGRGFQPARRCPACGQWLPRTYQPGELIESPLASVHGQPGGMSRGVRVAGGCIAWLLIGACAGVCVIQALVWLGVMK